MANLLNQLTKTDEYKNLPEFQQMLYEQMAGYIDEDPQIISLDTTELTTLHDGTTHEAWRIFLQLPVVERYIRSILKFNAGVSFRKAHKALTIEAERGNTQAAAQVTKISDILGQEQNNRTVVLTHVPRTGKPTTEPDPNTSVDAHAADIIKNAFDTTPKEPTTPLADLPATPTPTLLGNPPYYITDADTTITTIPDIIPSGTQPNPDFDHGDPLKHMRGSPRYKMAMGLPLDDPIPGTNIDPKGDNPKP